MSDAEARPPASVSVAVIGSDGDVFQDLVTVEEPLEIRVVAGPEGARVDRCLSVTMRTPGRDLELALGFLLGEAIIADQRDVVSIAPSRSASLDKGLDSGVTVELAADLPFDEERLLRHTLTTSSCGVCSKTSLDAVKIAIPPRDAVAFKVGPRALQRLPARLTAAQPEFVRTGGLHAAALFDSGGGIVRIREDVGRHNALDKLIGSCFLEDRKTLRRHGLLLSGRVSFEMVQKAAMAGTPLIAAIGAPSSLAIELAEECGVTLVGFLKADRFNVYCGTISG